jgi:hypothetical protein
MIFFTAKFAKSTNSDLSEFVDKNAKHTKLNQCISFLCALNLKPLRSLRLMDLDFN